MDLKVKKFFDFINGKKVALCGIGRTNLPLAYLFAQKGAIVTVCDKKPRCNFLEVAEKLEQEGITIKCGDDYLDNLNAEIIFRAPGLYYNSPKLNDYRKKGVVVTSEMEVFFDLCPAKIYAVTGSDGKTTTTSIIAQLLKRAGKKVFLGGNIGVPLLPKIEEISDGDCAVVELSSFQLISMRESPEVAVITNVAPNHLDVHSSMDEYVECKLNVINHQNAFSKAVLNLDNEITGNMQQNVRGQLDLFSRQSAVTNGAYCDKNGDIHQVTNDEKQFIINASDIFLKGEHNIENYLAAICAVKNIVSIEDIAHVAKTFTGVEHRIEFVREIGGVKYYNDSIATSPTRTIAGLKAFNTKIILIAGGYDKHIPYQPLAPFITKFVKVLILMGTTAKKIEDEVTNDKDYNEDEIKIIKVNNMQQAVNAAKDNAKNGDIVSLSPASAAFDLYKDFEARGNHFKELVNNLN